MELRIILAYKMPAVKLTQKRSRSKTNYTRLSTVGRSSHPFTIPKISIYLVKIQLEANVNADIETSILHDGICYVCVRVAFESTILIVFPKAIRINRQALVNCSLIDKQNGMHLWTLVITNACWVCQNDNVFLIV